MTSGLPHAIFSIGGQWGLSHLCPGYGFPVAVLGNSGFPHTWFRSEAGNRQLDVRSTEPVSWKLGKDPGHFSHATETGAVEAYPRL